MTIGDRIKQLRISQGMTQGELAKAVGLKTPAIYKYENGLVVNLKRTTIADLAKVLQTTPTYLMGFDDEEKPIPVSEDGPTDDELIRLWKSLSPEEILRVRDFVQGMIAARKEPPSRPE